jgi:hypothetical protein
VKQISHINPSVLLSEWANLMYVLEINTFAAQKATEQRLSAVERSAVVGQLLVGGCQSEH